jgi:hypothetical protein
MRYELKFNITLSELTLLFQWIKERPGTHKSYPNRKVYSIYFDTLDLDCAFENICGISNRKKYRLRWYKDIANNIYYGTRYELKSKNASLGTKEVLVSAIRPESLFRMNTFYIQRAISRENIGKIWRIYPHLFPNILVEYEREYYEAFNCIRITVDQKLKFHEISGDNHINDKWQNMFNGAIIEIKFSPEHRDLVSEMLQNFPFYPTRTSKYVLGLSYFNKVNYI